MSDLAVYGLIGVAVVAVSGLGLRLIFNLRSGNKVSVKNSDVAGDVVGGNKVEKK